MYPNEIYSSPAELYWHEPINLVDIDYNRKHELICQIPETYGIYIFHRRYAEFGEALYIGKASNLKRRISQELNAKELIEHIKEAKKGTKLLSFAELQAHGNCNKDKCIDDIESALIEISMYRGDHLFNTKKTKVYLQEITLIGEKPSFLEKKLYVYK
ncbi:hypothetical protein [Phytobacter sp. V91]|uniref:hypothetical protein n=1 Tax=Phytobacter sp. V91 TaxID=3369425 RepID=UPI003F5E52B1